MENQDARNPIPLNKNLLHIEYCTNCQSHNWNTHHNQAKYHQTYIKLKNLIESTFMQNPPLITANKVPQFLLPIKEQENKYYNQLTKKYMFFPNIGSFQITLNDQIIFSKKKTNNWPCFETILNQISIKIYNQPLQTKAKQQTKIKTNQTDTQFSSDQKIISQGFKTLYKQENKNSPKNFGKFTLTDHFKSFHTQNPNKSQEPRFQFDSSTTIKKLPNNKNNINVEDIEGLRQALKNKRQDDKQGRQQNSQKKSNQKQILINLCSIEEEGSNIKEIPVLRASSSFKKASVLVNSHPIQLTSAYNSSEKSLSIQRFQQLNNDFKKIEKQFQHIEKKMIISDQDQAKGPLNDSADDSRINNQKNQCQKNRNSRKQSQSGFVRSKLDSKENFVNNHYHRYSKQNKLLAYIANMQNSQIKATDRYDDRYVSPTYYEENQLYKNVPSKKYSEIEKYLKANNEEKNKKLKKIYGDWKMGSSNLNYLYNIDNGKKVLLRDSINTNQQTTNKQRKNEQQSNSSSDQLTSEQTNSQVNNFETMKHNANKKATVEEQQIKKHSSFIIKNKSSHKNTSNTNSKQKLSKYSLNEKSSYIEPRLAYNKNELYNPHESLHNGEIKQKFKKQNSKSFQVLANKTKFNGNTFAKREKYSLVQNTSPFIRRQIQRKQKSRQSHQNKQAQQINDIKSGSSMSKSNSYLSVSNSNDVSQQKISQSSKDQTSQKNMISVEKLPKIEEIKEVQFTQQSSNGKPSNRVTIEFHEFELKVKSTRRSNFNALMAQKQQQKSKSQLKDQKYQEISEGEKLLETEEKEQKQNFDDTKVDKISGAQTEQKQNLQNEIQNQKQNQNFQNQTIRNMSISQQVYVQLNLQETNQSQIMKTVLVSEQNPSNPTQKTSVPYLNLNQRNQDYIKSNQHLSKQSEINPKSKSNSSKASQNLVKKSNSHSRTSSLYEQPTFCHAVSHNLHETSRCKCQERIEQLQTNRMKIQSQRKQKQIIKDKNHEENQKRKEIIEKQKEQYLKQLETQIKQKHISHSNLKSQATSKKETAHIRSFSKQQSSNQMQNAVSKDKRAVSNIVQDRKSPFKNLTNQKPDQFKENKRESQPNFNQNKPIKSVTQTKNQKHKQQIGTKKPITTLETNSKGKSQSRNTLPSKTSQLSHQIPQILHSQKAKNQKKQSKSLSSKIHQKPTNKTKTASNQRNKSYFMTEKEKKMEKQNIQVKFDGKMQNYQQQQQRNTMIQVQAQKEETRSKCASIAIQTMEAEDWKKYSEYEKRDKTLRNKSIQSRHSSTSVKSARESLKSIKKKQIIKETYSPIQIEVKGGKTKVKKGKLKQKYQAKSRVSQKSHHQRNKSSESQGQSEKTIVDIFQQDQNPQQIISQLNLNKKAKKSVPYRGQRQKALILKQLYNIDTQLKNELKHYESLYQANSLYCISQRQVITHSTGNPILQSLIQHEENILNRSGKISFTQVENTVKENSKNKKISLFGTDSISIHKLRSNWPQQTNNLHKTLEILTQKSQLLIVRLFEDYKSETNFFYLNVKQKILLSKQTYAVWLCINKTWKLIYVDNIVPVKLSQLQKSSQPSVKPLFSYHEENQLWPQILEKCLAQAVGGYTKLFSLSIGQLFSILTGSNHLTYTINDNLSKNKLFLKEVTQNDKKNFIMVCQKHPTSLKEQNDKSTEPLKIYYLLSKKIVRNNQSDEILFKMRESILDQSAPNTQPYYIRYDNFSEKFKTCEVLHLRQHHYFCSLKLNQTLFSNKSKKSNESYFNVIQLIFDEQTFGTITVCNEAKSDIKTYLYKLENSDNQIMKLVGQATKNNKKELFFDCYFQEQTYFLFIQSSNPNSVVSFMGEGKPEIKIKEQILSNGLRNQLIEYLPVQNYEGIGTGGSVMVKSTNSNFYPSQNESNKKLRNMEDLREMFIELLTEERKKK